MKKSVIASLITGTLLFTTQVCAAEDNYLAEKQSGTMLGTTAAGAVLGGPIGALIGMTAGYWLTTELEQAAEADQLSVSLTQTQQQLAEHGQTQQQMEQALAALELRNQQLAQQMLDQLQLATSFRTNDSALSSPAQQQVELLANYLRANPDVRVRLDGYADPRGSANHNQSLSEARVQTVVTLLTAAGVPAEQIEARAHGAAQSTAAQGDQDAYAMERVVTIELSRERSDSVSDTAYAR